MREKWKGRKRTGVIRMGITPTKERCRQHGGIKTEILSRGGRGFMRYRAVWECPLDAYRDLKLIDRAEYEAGRQFHRAYYGAIICCRPDFRPTSRNRAEMKPTKSDLLLRDVYAALPIEDLGVVIDICGHSAPARNQRALNILKRGLGHLVTHWNMAANEVCKRK